MARFFMVGVCLIIFYILVATGPVVFSLLDNADSDNPFLVDVAFAFAMLGFSLLCLQVLLAGRFKAVDRPFGLDMLMQFHKVMAVAALLLLLSHPLLLAAGRNSLALFSFQTSWVVNLGKAALALLLLGVLFALSFKKLKVDYNLWRFMHKAMVFVIILGFIHALIIGPDLESGLAKAYWIALFSVASAVFLYRNIAVPLLCPSFKVSDVHQETHDTYTLTFEPEDGRKICRNPGQFMFLRLLRPGRKCETHPFTISASALKTEILQATIKQSGNFTNTIDQTVPGDIGRIEAGFGRFSYVYANPAKILFIAGGVGITPIMSMMRCLRDTGDTRAVTLLYGNKKQQDIIFKDEIAALPDNFKTVHVLSESDDSWQGEKGFITPAIIERYAGDLLEDAHVYLCGPPLMMKKVIESLRGLGVSDSRIHYEHFTI